MTAAISVVVVSRGLTALLRVCLERAVTALEAVGPADHEMIVVDNATPVPYRPSEVGSAARLVRFDVHRSFARSCNVAVDRSAGELLLMLNNDVLLHPLAIVEMVQAMADPHIAVCGTRLVFPDDTIQHHGVVFGPDDQGPYHDHRGVPTAIVPRGLRLLQAVTGACMLVRSDVYRELGGFDEGYDFGLEDIDFCLRARRAGHGVVCVQGHDSLHFESMTEGRIELDVGSRRRFMETWHGRYTVDVSEDAR